MNAPRARLFVVLVAWSGLVAVAALAGWPRLLPPAIVPLFVVLLTVSAVTVSLRAAWARAAIARCSSRALIAVHLFRFVGAVFLWLQTQGRLPADFAQRAGWGDIAAAVGALVLLAWPEGKGFRRAALAWTVFGVLDLFVAVGTAAVLNRTHPGSMAHILTFPLLLVPGFAVPVLLAAHIALWRRLRADPADERAANLPAVSA